MRNSLKVARAKLDMTQATLAEKAKVSRQTINAIEQGNYNPSTTLTLKLSVILQTPVDELFKLEEKDWE